ncbi:Probable arsenic-transport integral membrane protein ArsC [Mycobacteroides abscessus]|nr:Probable arsenic-transport integral membrane protein ArsC [Mycobacteroides abscessus]CPX05078.1 Probable arsenic-transport integral membrane protein ArsC [Mycobacteroides abscessus]
MSQATAARNADTTVGKLSTLDRYLPLWIGLAMTAGLLLGRNVPGLNSALEKVQVDGISLPIAVGLLIMMYPVLAKVRYDRLGSVAADRRLLAGSLVLNWVLGPALMFTLAWLLLPDLPEYRTGLIIVGLARCIAMVIIWNDLACGDREAAAVLVALNSLFQVLTFAALGWFYLSLLPGWLHLPQTTITASPWEIAKSVLIFLGIPLMAGYLSRRFGEKVKGRGWYESKFLPAISPWALYGLLFTIVILFALQGAQITSHPWDVARIALPLLAYFAIMWGGGYLLGASLGLGYARTTTLAFTAAGNNFELAIAVAIATYGATSGQALAGVVGPLIEGSIEYGAVMDHTPLMVVLGHQRCGAVTAAVKSLEQHNPAPAHLADVVEALKPAYLRAKQSPQKSLDDLIEGTIRAQIQLTVNALRADPPLASNTKNNELRIVGAYYTLDTGVVSWLDQ